MRHFLLIFLVIPALISNAQKLSKTEKRIIEYVEGTDQAAIDFLEKVVNINSGSMNHEGVKEVADVFSTEFQEIGFETSWIDQSEVDRSGHLFAEIAGSKGKRLLLIGHLDTVFPKESDFQKFNKQDTLAYGPGANDMKGGNVIILYALKALHEAGALKNAQIIVAFTGAEEMPGKPISKSRYDLVEAGKRSDIALGYETSTGFSYATVARRGSSGWKLQVTGKRAHSSGVFNERVGAGAIFEMSRILHRFYEEVRGEEFLTFNPGVILGGTEVNLDDVMSRGSAFGKTNVVAQTAVVKGGLRFISEEQKESARAKMRQIVSESLPGTSAEISFTDSYPAMGPTDGNMKLLEELNQVSLDLDQGEVKAWDPGRRGAADISFVAEYVDGMDGLGTMGSGAHTPNETVNLKTMNDLTKRTAILIYRLINQKR